jgi:DNA polymerase
VEAETALHRSIGVLPPDERRVWLLDQMINERGVRIDGAFVSAARRVVEQATKPLVAEFADLTGGLSFTQVAKFKAWCGARGLDLPDMRKETLVGIGVGDEEDESDIDEPALFDATEFGVCSDEVRRALEIRALAASASVKKLAALERCVCGDHRARGALRYHGAGTGRWSGQLLQPQNFPRGTLKIKDAKGREHAVAPDVLVDAIMSGDADYVAAVVGSPIEAVVSGLRHAIVAGPNKTLVAGDFAAIEARVVLALAGQTDKVALLAAGGPVYEDMAQTIYGHPVNKADQPEERQVGKNAVLGCGFGMGWPKFKARYAKDKSDEFAQSVIDAYREDWAPAVPKLWWGLERAALETMRSRTPHEAYGVVYAIEDAWMTARLPSGRKLWYYGPSLDRKAVPWDKDEIRECWSYWAKKVGQWTKVYAYGGLLTENVVQALARDLMVYAMFACERELRPIVLTVHDEIVVEPPLERADPKMLQQLMEDAPEWAQRIGIPVAAKTWVGQRYRK